MKSALSKSVVRNKYTTTKILIDPEIFGIKYSCPIPSLATWKVWIKRTNSPIRSVLHPNFRATVTGISEVYGTCIDTAFNLGSHNLLDIPPFDVQFYCYDPIQKYSYVNFVNHAVECRFIVGKWTDWEEIS